MKITHTESGRVLADDARTARSFISRLVGLIGRRGLGRGEALVITPCSSIHTFWMRFAIDVVFFDAGDRVVAVVRRMRPFRLTRIHRLARGVVELPAGALDDIVIKPGDRLDMRG